MKEKRHNMLNNHNTVLPLCLSTNQNDSEILCPCIQSCLTQTWKELHVWSKMSRISDTKRYQSGIKKKVKEHGKHHYLQVYVISKLSLMFTMSIWGRSLGGSVSWDNANLKAACSWDCWLGNNPPGEKNRTRRNVLSTPILATSSVQNIPVSRGYSSPAQRVSLHSKTLQHTRPEGFIPAADTLGAENLSSLCIL